MHPPLDPARLRHALSNVGLPMCLRAEPIGRASHTATYRLTFAEGIPSHIFKLPVRSPGWDVLASERGALDLLQFEDIPTALVVADLDVGRRGLLLTDLPGRTGADPAVLGRAIAQVHTGLIELRSRTFGTRGMPGGFAPIRPTWRDSWSAFHHVWWRQIRDSSVLNGLAEGWHQEVLDGLPLLDSADEWCLVHRDLHPGNLLFDGGKLTGVIDWGSALIGDPLVEWVQPLQLGGDTLRAFLAEMGRERVDQVLEGEGWRRLEVYLKTRCVARVAQTLTMSDARAAIALEVARLQHVDVRVQLETCAPFLLPAPRSILTRRLVERFAAQPLPKNVELWNTSMVLVLTLNDADAVDQVLQQLPASLGGVPEEPVLDRGAWRAALCARAAADLNGIAVFTWLALGLLDHLQGSVSDGTLRGIQGVVETGIARPVQPSTMGRLNECLARLLLTSADGEALCAEVRDAYEVLVPVSPRPCPLPPIWSQVPTSPAHARLAVLWLLLTTLGEACPIDADACWAGCQSSVVSQNRWIDPAARS